MELNILFFLTIFDVHNISNIWTHDSVMQLKVNETEKQTFVGCINIHRIGSVLGRTMFVCSYSLRRVAMVLNFHNLYTICLWIGGVQTLKR